MNVVKDDAYCDSGPYDVGTFPQGRLPRSPNMDDAGRPLCLLREESSCKSTAQRCELTQEGSRTRKSS
ncbi:hypothetical protein EVAR_27114_1 [Eumeta japonica]|uniref:Uncharacterized protein n=1 Tax=Eumeta variegata TaxID=151549 RepID=A0A4C1VMM7_EUMVA|nr:hypothetical protein EVAR_27114_1 [Eumeta japonica]